MKFKDREQAGEYLADALHRFENDPNSLVLAIPRGGIVPAYVIAMKLNLPLDILMVKKLGHPLNPELAIGAVSLDELIVLNGYSEQDAYIQDEVIKVRAKIKEQLHYFRKNDVPLKLRGKKVIIVDDGIATGLTLSLGIQLVRKSGASEIIIAVPVAAKDSLSQLEKLVDQSICLYQPEDFNAVGTYYENFDQVENETVRSLLQK